MRRVTEKFQQAGKQTDGRTVIVVVTESVTVILTFLLRTKYFHKYIRLLTTLLISVKCFLSSKAAY